MADDSRKKSLPEQKRLVREAIRKLTDATLTDDAVAAAPSARGTANGRHKVKLPGERYSGRDA